jgi:hypothetical protein
MWVFSRQREQFSRQGSNSLHASGRVAYMEHRLPEVKNPHLTPGAANMRHFNPLRHSLSLGSGR